MNETDYNSKENKLAVAQGLIDGNEIQVLTKHDKKWVVSNTEHAPYIPSFLSGNTYCGCIFRVKPAPKTRLLGPEDVKPGCAISRDESGSEWRLVQQTDQTGVIAGGYTYPYETLAKEFFILYPNTETFVKAVKEVEG